MAIYLIGYSIIALVVSLVVFIELVSHKVIFKNAPKIQMIFGHPLVRYSLRRMLSAVISILLAITATMLLLRFKVNQNNGVTFCNQILDPKLAQKFPEQFKDICTRRKEALGITDNVFLDLLRYFYYVFPFPKTVCRTVIDTSGSVAKFEYTDCKNTIMYLGEAYFVAGEKGTYVTELIFSRMIESFKIGIIGVLIEVGLGYPMGILMAKRKDGVFDRIGNAYIISIDAIPGVAYYYIWVVILCTVLHLPRSFVPLNEGADWFKHVASYLPAALTMGFTGMAGIAIWVRRYMLDEFNSDYVKFARAKGLSENRILGIHVLRNAIVPLVRSIPSAILGALLGAFFLEKIYSIGGFGILAYQVESAGTDLYVLQGIVIVTAMISVISYLFGDIVTAIIDPRVSFSDE